MTVIDIFVLFLVIAAIILCVYLVITLKKLAETILRVEEDVHKLSEKTIPLLENLNEAAKKIVNITNEAEKHVEDVNNAVAKFKQRVEDIKTGFVHTVNPDNPMNSMIRTISGIVKGFTAFWKKFTN